MRAKQEGVALVIVLWMLVLFLLMSFSYSKAMRAETKLAASTIYNAKVKAMAEAGVWYGINELLKPKQERNWPIDSTPQTFQFESADITVSINDENSRIDINSASSELLYSALKGIDVPEDDRLPLLHSILDWRDRDTLKRLHGSEKADYESAGFPYLSKDGPFSHISELQKVMGMKTEWYQKLKPAITIHSRQSGINLKTATKEVLLLLPGIHAENVGDLLESRQLGNINETARLYGLDDKYLIRTSSRAYRIISVADYNGYTATLDTVFLVRQNRKKPYTTLAWDWSEK